eukprot:TRINITY_DN2793_c0_g5_i1.p1 TRINITY_DN2793_c0_g5~~TRINITY_DN2793_c0_g5_i1.p1  ORF type:complete len:260 (-),score=40.37 TRINITY_DN2793_c0_g5_i1:260-1039(-)
MHRAEVMPNTLVVKKWQERLYALHRERVCNPRAFFPRISPGAQSVLKKAKNSVRRLEKCNKRSSSFMERLPPYSRMPNSMRKHNSNYSIPVNNTKHQMSELYRITKENVRLLRNLICKQSQYDLQKWKQDEKVRKKYIKLRCMFPIDLKSTKKKQKQIRSRTNKKISTTMQDEPRVGSDNFPLHAQKSNEKELIYEAYDLQINGKAYDVKFYAFQNDLIVGVQDNTTETKLKLSEDEGITQIITYSEEKVWQHNILRRS